MSPAAARRPLHAQLPPSRLMLFSPVPQPRTEIRYHPFTFHVTLLLSKPNPHPGWEAGLLSTQWLDTKSSHRNPYLYTALVGSQRVGVFRSQAGF